MRQRISIVYVGALALLLILGGCANTQNNFVEGKQQFLLGDYHQAFAKLQPLAVEGNPQAQYAVGYMYFYGLGTVQNYEAAQKWMVVAAEQGHPEARAALAKLDKLAPPPPPSALPDQHSAIFEDDTQFQRNPHTQHSAKKSSEAHHPIAHPQTAEVEYHGPPPMVKPKTKSKQPIPLAAAEPPEDSIVPEQTPLPEPMHESSPAPVVAAPLSQEKAKGVAPQVPAPVPLVETLGAKPIINKQEEAEPEAIAVAKANVESEPAIAPEANVEPKPRLAPKPKATPTVKKGSYTLQLMGAFTVDALNDFAAKHHLQPTIKQAAELHQGRTWYVLTYGEYPTQAAAQVAIKELPGAIQHLKPWVRRASKLAELQEA